MTKHLAEQLILSICDECKVFVECDPKF